MSHVSDLKYPGIEKTFMADMVGPGYWSLIHSNAANATDDKKKMFFMAIMNHIRNTFPCGTCKGHINEYMKENPLEKVMHLDDGCFLWTWKFHNAVNRRTSKREVPLEEAMKIYKKEACDAVCSSSLPVVDKQDGKTNDKTNDMIVDINKSSNFDKVFGYVVKPNNNFRGM